MANESSNAIIITEGYWMHIRHTRAFHRRYPDVRGDGRSPSDAAGHLENKLELALDFAHGRERESIERAIADVRAFLASRSRRGRGAVVSST